MPEVRYCVNYFTDLASTLKAHAWENLFRSDLSNATFNDDSWVFADGALTRNGGGYIWTKKKYENFILDLEFKLAEGTNSGVFVRAGELKNYVQSSIEVQIHETTDGTKHGACGAIYDCLSPKRKALKETGEWNRYTITCQDSLLYVVLNGEQIIAMNLNNWDEPNKNPDGTANKFKTAIKDMPKEGYIGFQDHGQPIWFRNLKLREL